MNKQIEIGSEARKKLVKGIDKLANVVTSTLGVAGRCVVYEENGEVKITKDGVSVAKSITKLEDPIENLGAQMIKEASIKTANNAGDGTTSSTLLAQQIVKEGLSYIDKGHNAVEIKRGIDEAVKEVVIALRKDISKEITSQEQIQQIATISANNDEEIGKLVAQAIEKVGIDGAVHVEESKSGETYLETVEGIQFDRGYKSHFFVTDNNSMSCTLEDPYILITDKRFSQVKELLPVLQYASDQGKSLLIICDDIDGEALATLIVNKMRGTIKVCAVKAPDFGDRKKLILEDIAILTGGQVVSSEKGMNIEKQFSIDWFGKSRIATINKEKTTIVDGKGNEQKIQSRAEELKNQIDNSKTPFEREQLQNRLAKFTGGISIIHVGGNSELEIKEKKDRVDDALNAAKSAIEEGIVPGGGCALLYARKVITNSTGDKEIGKNIIYKACASPITKILNNAGYGDIKWYQFKSRTEKIIGELKKGPYFQNWLGYNLKEEKFCNMKDSGIIDPTKVVRNSIENAASVAGTILLTEGVITSNENGSQANPIDMMGGMM